MNKVLEFFKTYRKVLAIVAVVCVFGIAACVVLPYLLINANKKYVYSELDNVLRQNQLTLLVLGGGVNEDGTPKPLLQNRLEAAIKLYQTGNVAHIIVSGDNRFAFYNEPQAMKKYLVTKTIPEEVIQEDYAGRSTYESCERARKIFDLQKVVVVSQRSHLPRAIYLCRSFGVQAIGFAAEDVESISRSQKFRELLANAKAVFNVYIIGEKTVLGDKINL